MYIRAYIRIYVRIYIYTHIYIRLPPLGGEAGVCVFSCCYWSPSLNGSLYPPFNLWSMAPPDASNSPSNEVGKVDPFLAAKNLLSW